MVKSEGENGKKKRSAGSAALAVVAVLLLFASLCLLIYPTAVRKYEDYMNDRVITTFDRLAEEVQNNETETPSEETEPAETDGAEEMAEAEATEENSSDDGFTPDPSSYQALRQAMEEYNRDIYENGQNGLTDAWSYQQAQFDLSEWGITSNILGYVEIPSIDSRLPIYLGATNANMRKGAVCMGQTSLPIGGINTACVLAAHRGYSGIPFWRNIEGISVGDTVTVTNLWETLTYQVTKLEVIWPYEINKILIQPNKDMLILTTCHPYRGHSKYRYVVYCERADDAAGTVEDAGTEGETVTESGNTFSYDENGNVVISGGVNETTVQGITDDDIGVSAGITFESSQNAIMIEDMLQYAAAGTAGIIILVIIIMQLAKHRKKD